MATDLKQFIQESADEALGSAPAPLGARAEDAVVAYVCRRLLLAANRRLLADVVRPLVRAHLRPDKPGVPRASRSARWRGVTETIFTTPVPIDHESWKPLGECTRSDVQAVAMTYWKRADQNAAVANRYTALLGRMDAADVQVVSELHPKTVQGIVEGQVPVA